MKGGERDTKKEMKTNKMCLLDLDARTCRDFSCGSCDDDGTFQSCILHHSADLCLHGRTGEERKVSIMPECP